MWIESFYVLKHKRRLKNDKILKTLPQACFIGQFTSDHFTTFFYATFSTDPHEAPHFDCALEIIYCLQRLSLKSGFALVQTLPAACWRFAMVRISDNGPG